MTSRKENERTKLIQEKCQTLLNEMLRDEDNKYCVDCDAKGPRWASWNLGVFLCIRCAGIHRNLGVHISRVKSVNLDSWTPEQVVSLQQMGNSRARAVYEAQLPDGFRRPQSDTALESFIRAKYEHKKYLAREWVPPSPPKVDWAKEIDEEIEKQKRKKKSSGSQALAGLSGSLASTSNISINNDKKTSSISSAAIKNTPLPAPLPKPKSSNSPKITNRVDLNVSNSSTGSNVSANNSSDLLGLSSPTNAIPSNIEKSQNGSDSFTNFLSGNPSKENSDPGQNLNKSNGGGNSLAKEEEDFFKQTTTLGSGERDKTGKLTKDSILALYGTANHTGNPGGNIGQFNNNAMTGNMGGFNANFAANNFVQATNIPNTSQMFSNLSSGVGSVSPNPISANINLNLAGMPQGFIGPPHQINQLAHPSHQFMQPTSNSMYNAPVKTAPSAFNNAPMSSGTSTVPLQFANNMSIQQQQNFGQFPTHQSSMNVNNIQMNQQMGMTNMFPNAFVQSANVGGSGIQINPINPNFSNPLTGNMTQQTQNVVGLGQQPSSNTGNLNQQFGNLNLGNVWQ